MAGGALPFAKHQLELGGFEEIEVVLVGVLHSLLVLIFGIIISQEKSDYQKKDPEKSGRIDSNIYQPYKVHRFLEKRSTYINVQRCIQTYLKYQN